LEATTRACALFIAAGVAVAGLHAFRGVLAPLALAVFLWLIMDGFARLLQRGAREIAHRQIPWPLALAVAAAIVVAAVLTVIVVIGSSATEFARRGPDYIRRITEVAHQLFARLPFGEEAPANLSSHLGDLDLGRFFLGLAGAARSMTSNGLYVGLYIVFLFAAQGTFAPKMRAIFPDTENRERASRLLNRIRESMERYLAVQTLVSALGAFAAYVTLLTLGLEGPIFWAFLTFLLGYIPTVGSIVATILPAVFALVQFNGLWRPAAVLLGLGVWHFLFGNFVQPRLQGRSLNLAMVVVLLGLVLWGEIWGLVGMFLSSPLTATVMLLLAQAKPTRWIAVLMSSDGRPEVGGGAAGE
jgi:predicted PurR-regulated permease PerM